jgi:hypothetical protein
MFAVAVAVADREPIWSDREPIWSDGIPGGVSRKCDGRDVPSDPPARLDLCAVSVAAPPWDQIPGRSRPDGSMGHV